MFPQRGKERPKLKQEGKAMARWTSQDFYNLGMGLLSNEDMHEMSHIVPSYIAFGNWLKG